MLRGMRFKAGATAVIVAATMVTVALPVRAHFAECPPDAVKVGDICIDKYEGSVWQVLPTSRSGKNNRDLIEKILHGKVGLRDLLRGGATMRGGLWDEGSSAGVFAA